MLVADIEYRVGQDASPVKLKGYLSATFANTVGRLVATEGDSANFLMDGVAGHVNKLNRSFTFGKSNVTFEKLFKRGECVVEGVDCGSTAYVREQAFYRFIAQFYAVYTYARTYKSEKTTFRFGDVIGSDDGSTSQDVVDIFETPVGKFKVIRVNGVIRELLFNSETLTISMLDVPELAYNSQQENRALFGSGIMVMESNGSAYKIEVSKSKIQKMLGVSESKPLMELEGITTSSFSPFFDSIEELLQMHSDKEISWIKNNIDNKTFVIVDDSTLEQSFENLKADYVKTQASAFDTETTGLDFTFKCLTGEGSEIVGAVLSCMPNTSYYFPLKHTKFDNVCGGDVDLFVEKWLQPFMRDINIITHNNYFDYKVALSMGLDYDCYFDTMVFVNKTLREERYIESGLKPLTKMFLKRDVLELDDLCRNGDYNETVKTTGKTFADLPKDLVQFYACPDADNTVSLYLYFKENGIIDHYGAWKTCLNDSAFSSVVAYSEFYGVHLNLDAIPDLRVRWQEILDTRTARVIDFLERYVPQVDLSNYKITKNDINKKIAYEYLGYPVQYSKKSGNVALDKDAVKALSRTTLPPMEPFSVDFEKLLKLAKKHSVNIKAVSVNTEHELTFAISREYKGLGFDSTFEFDYEKNEVRVSPQVNAPQHPFARLLKDALDANRVFTNFLNKVDTDYTSDGFCFPRIDAFKVTGRLSYREPNIQGYDDHTKKEIRARDGFYMVDMDYSSKESRVIAILSQEKPLLEMFSDWRNDYHRFQAAKMAGKRQELVSDSERGGYKGVNFGIVFGMGDQSLGQQIFGHVSPMNTMKAKEKRKQYFSIQPNVEKWFDGNVREALRNGYSQTVFGSRRFYNLERLSKSSVRRFALNHPIQGSAADIYKAGMVSLYNDIRKNGYLGKILITGFIHDEALLEFHESIHPHEALGLLRKNMMVELPNGCPLYIGFGVGRSWYDAKKTEWQVGLQEQLEWNTDAYDWDGDIDSYIEWSTNRIRNFNAEDVIALLDSGKHENDVLPVNYSLELNSYLKATVGIGDNWLHVLQFLGDDYQTIYSTFKEKGSSKEMVKTLLESGDYSKDELFSVLEKAKNLAKSEVGNFHIHDRLVLLKEFYGYHHDGLEDKYIDVSELEETVTQTTDEDIEKQAEERERERQLQLVKNQVADFGAVANLEDNTLLLLYKQPFYAFVKPMLVLESDIPESEREDYLRVFFYNFEKDKILEIQGYRLPTSQLSTVTSNAFVYV